MPRRKISHCLKFGCDEPPYLGGLCEEHHNQEESRQTRRMYGRDLLLKSVVDGRILSNKELQLELSRLQRWWDRACRSVNFNRTDPLLQDEAEYAIEWCLSISASIVEEERIFRQQSELEPSLRLAREQVWMRFTNLEAGLMSNGIPRDQKN